MLLLKKKHQVLVGVTLLLILLSGSVSANQAIPPGFSLVMGKSGIELYRKDYAEGNPDFVQVVNLDQGARVELSHGNITDPGDGQGVYGGASPLFDRQSLQKVWNDFSVDNADAFCITNGQFFVTDDNPTELAFPLKKDGIVVSDGYGISEYPDQKLILEIWDDHAVIIPLTKESLYASPAPNIIAGLSEEADKGPNNFTGRTFVGIADGNNDEQCETILIFNSKTARQKDAANILRGFGAEKVIMLDGGGSTQLICEGESYVSSDRTIPQTLVTTSSNLFSVPLGFEEWWEEQEAKLDAWWKEKQEEVIRQIEREIEIRLQELCGTVALPFVVVGVIVVLGKRKYM